MHLHSLHVGKDTAIFPHFVIYHPVIALIDCKTNNLQSSPSDPQSYYSFLTSVNFDINIISRFQFSTVSLRNISVPKYNSQKLEFSSKVPQHHNKKKVISTRTFLVLLVYLLRLFTLHPSSVSKDSPLIFPEFPRKFRSICNIYAAFPNISYAKIRRKHKQMQTFAMLARINVVTVCFCSCSYLSKHELLLLLSYELNIKLDFVFRQLSPHFAVIPIDVARAAIRMGALPLN